VKGDDLLKEGLIGEEEEMKGDILWREKDQ
jgi:hypothetical protein